MSKPTKEEDEYQPFTHKNMWFEVVLGVFVFAMLLAILFAKKS